MDQRREKTQSRTNPAQGCRTAVQPSCRWVRFFKSAWPVPNCVRICSYRKNHRKIPRRTGNLGADPSIGFVFSNRPCCSRIGFVSQKPCRPRNPCSLRRRQESHDLVHDPGALVRLEKELSVRRTIHNDQFPGLKRLLKLAANGVSYHLIPPPEGALPVRSWPYRSGACHSRLAVSASSRWTRPYSVRDGRWCPR